MKAYCLIRSQPYYRREAFVSGLRAAGHEVSDWPPAKVDENTLLVMWNRYSTNAALALQVESVGGKVIVAENGYLGKGGSIPKWDVHPQGPANGDYYALALGGHNGNGDWSSGGAQRWLALGVSLKPLRSEGKRILVCPNRPFGVNAMPHDWPVEVIVWLRESTQMEITVRPHPGNACPARPLHADLKDCYAMVIWSSGAGVHALVAGIPVICCAPAWIAKRAAQSSWRDLEVTTDPEQWDRLRAQAFERMAWAQWTAEEIASGKPFDHLLRRAA